jgi:propanol-preferring alcohol dehydrogenase
MRHRAVMKQRAPDDSGSADGTMSRPSMRAMVLKAPHTALLESKVPVPEPHAGEVLVKVRACGLCRTDLHVVDGELERPKLPLIPGHQIVGEVVTASPDVSGPRVGQRVGIPWLGWTCGSCEHCLAGRENLCDNARFTGYDIDGGYAEYAVAHAAFCFPIPEDLSDIQAAPLLCAGLIGYRSLVAAGDARRLGLYGFGAAAHIVAQVARHQGRRVFAITRPGDIASQDFARRLGAEWAGDTTAPLPVQLDAAIIFAPAGELVPLALAATRSGGTVVCAGIHMSDIPTFPYALLWHERTLRSVANLTRRDGAEFFALVSHISIHSSVTQLPLERANEALVQLKAGNVQGAIVLRVGLSTGAGTAS